VAGGTVKGDDEVAVLVHGVVSSIFEEVEWEGELHRKELAGGRTAEFHT
jgi:hypothetical protein